MVEEGKPAPDFELHTDAGDGHSQATHWTPNVETPPPTPD